MNRNSRNEHSATNMQTQGVLAVTVGQGGRTVRPPGPDACASCEPLSTFPCVRVREDHELVHVLTELPGIDADELEISVDGTLLTLQGRRKENSGLFRVDRGLQKFLCRIELPSAVDPTRGEAYLDMGVLSLTLPKLVSERPRTVQQNH